MGSLLVAELDAVVARAGRPDHAGAPLLRSKPPWRHCGMTFARFRASAQNALAFLAAQRAAEGTLPVPLLYFCGPPASGKTHLLWSIACRLHADPGKKVCYLAAGQWAGLCRRCGFLGQLGRLERECATLDALLIDHLQDLSGRLGAQRTLCRAIDLTIQRGGWVAAGAQVRPFALELLEPLKDRLAGGLILALETREKQVPGSSFLVSSALRARAPE